jgi:STAS domain
LSAAAAPGSRVIVDLAGLTFMDCSCLHVLVSARKQALQAGGDLLLAAPRGPVARLLSLIDLTGWLSVFASAEEAANGDGMPPVAVCLAPEQADGEVNPGGGQSITGRGAVPSRDDMHGERRPEVPAEAAAMMTLQDLGAARG